MAVAAESININRADTRTRRKHDYKLKHSAPVPNTNELKNFITVRSVSEWNLLPSHVVQSETTDAFKERLHSHRLATEKSV